MLSLLLYNGDFCSSVICIVYFRSPILTFFPSTLYFYQSRWSKSTKSQLTGQFSGIATISISVGDFSFVLVGSPDDESMLRAEGPKFYTGEMGLGVAISNDSSPSDADASHKGQDGSPLDGQ